VKIESLCLGGANKSEGGGVGVISDLRNEAHLQ
jgi:hypothetical protein